MPWNLHTEMDTCSVALVSANSTHLSQEKSFVASMKSFSFPLVFITPSRQWTSPERLSEEWRAVLPAGGVGRGKLNFSSVCPIRSFSELDPDALTGMQDDIYIYTYLIMRLCVCLDTVFYMHAVSTCLFLHFCISAFIYAFLHFCISASRQHISAFLHFCISAFLNLYISEFTHFCISAFLHFCISARPATSRIYIYTFLHFCSSAFLHFCISEFIHFCISAFLHFCISEFLHFCISASLHFCISTFLHFYIYARIWAALLRPYLYISAFMHVTRSYISLWLYFYISTFLHFCIQVPGFACLMIIERLRVGRWWSLAFFVGSGRRSYRFRFGCGSRRRHDHW